MPCLHQSLKTKLFTASLIFTSNLYEACPEVWSSNPLPIVFSNRCCLHYFPLTLDYIYSTLYGVCCVIIVYCSMHFVVDCLLYCRGFCCVLMAVDWQSMIWSLQLRFSSRTTSMSASCFIWSFSTGGLFRNFFHLKFVL